MSEAVNHPDHYKAGGLECIEVMRAVYGEQTVFKFCLCNAFKYLFRANKKHETPLDDIKKAAWYLNYIVEHKEEEQ